MRRVFLLTIIGILAASCAAPYGAAFAMEGSGENGASIPIPLLDTTASSPGTMTVHELQQTAEKSQQATVNDVAVPKPSVPPATIKAEAIPTIVQQTPSVVVEPIVPLPVSPLLITAYKSSGAHLHAVQLYNNTSDMLPLEGFSLTYVAGSDEYQIALPEGWVEPRSYIIAAWRGESLFADIEYHFTDVGSGRLESIELHHKAYQPLIVTVSPLYKGDLLHRFKSTAGNYTTNVTFATGSQTISGGGLYVLPGRPEISIREILVHPRDCIFGMETPDCYDYIKIKNVGATPVDLSLYRLRSGFSNVKSSSLNTTYFSDVIEPGQVLTLTHDRDKNRVGFSSNDGTVWMEDAYGYISYDLAVPPYSDSDLSAQTGRSWAFNDTTGGWQWATPSPFAAENDFSILPVAEKSATSTPRTLVPCRDDQYRSEETNRCRNLVMASPLKPCAEGQYRSEETNRCRSLAAAVATILKPCADDQFRNPATNRCKKIASADEVALADCGEGRERNPSTNRCRNVLGLSTAAGAIPYSVEEKGGDERFSGWLTVIVVTLLGSGYALWEWKLELKSYLSRGWKYIARFK